MSGEIVVLARDRSKEEMLALAVEQGIEVRWVDPAQDPAALVEQCKGAVAMIGGDVTLELAKGCPNLRLVQSMGAGTDALDLPGLAELGITVANNGGGNSVAVAEHAIMLMVGIYRRLHLQVMSMSRGKWYGDIPERFWSETHELTGRRVGIVGGGHIGRQVARRLQGWECELVYSDVVEMPADAAKELGIPRVSLDELLTTSDVVSLHVPLNNRTRGMIGDRELGLMKPTAVLINTCRGGVVDEAALVRALRAGKIAGAGLDVLEEEPTPADNPLLHMDNVMVTPHLAGMSQEASRKSQAFALANAARVVAGEKPLSVVALE